MIFSCKPKKSSFLSNNKGFSIVEALVGITIAALLILAFTSLITQSIKITEANKKGVKATMYLQELIEIAKDLEQSDWDELATTTHAYPFVCHPVATMMNIWELNPNEEYLEDNIYTRWLTIEDVCRDSSKNIDICPSDELSTSTKKVIATITWNNGFENQTSTLETYVYTY